MRSSGNSRPPTSIAPAGASALEERTSRRGTRPRRSSRWIPPLFPALLASLGALRALEDRDLEASVLPFSDRGLRRAMTRACKHAEIPAFTPHDLHYRYISLLVMAGVPLSVVREVVGTPAPASRSTPTRTRSWTSRRSSSPNAARWSWNAVAVMSR